jgi:AcrR family transcriptional regulator
MPRPRSLSESVIAAAALAVIERDGLAALTMRAVGAELGVGTMSLYRYVTGRDQLEQLVVDLVLERVDVDVPPRATWHKKIAILAGSVRAAVGVHSAVVPLLLSHRHTSLGSLRWGEAVLAALTEGGFERTRRVVAFRALMSYTLGAVQVEHLGPLAGPGTTAIAALPRDRFPLLSETARAALRVSADDEFRRGLAVLLRGLRH